MHNFYAKYVKILDICKHFSKNLVNELGNVPRRGVVPKFSDFEVIALSLTAESLRNCLDIFPRSYLLQCGGIRCRELPPLRTIHRYYPL